MLIDNLANLNRSTRTTVYTALIIIAAIAMYDWIVAPHVTCLSASQQYESVVSKAVEKNKVITRDVATKTKKLEELREQLARSRSILFAPGEAKAFFSDLQAIAEETGCTVHALNLVVSGPSSGNKQKQSEDTSGIVANGAVLSVIGQYDSIFRLVEKLQNHPKRIWMDSFKIETINSDSAQLKCDMTITIYTIQDKGAAL
jgi:cell division protein ZapA (FtsZ GTPase activity inhibitor)